MTDQSAARRAAAEIEQLLLSHDVSCIKRTELIDKLLKREGQACADEREACAEICRKREAYYAEQEKETDATAMPRAHLVRSIQRNESTGCAMAIEARAQEGG